MDCATLKRADGDTIFLTESGFQRAIGEVDLDHVGMNPSAYDAY